MFTGIIEEAGTIISVQKRQKSSALGIGAQLIFDDLKIGDSVAVNGVCLTASGIERDTFTADVMSETLDRSALGQLRIGDRVNLERAMPANGRFGGHIVTGHIDGIGRIESIKREHNAVWLAIQAAPRVMRYIVEKGSVAIDGVSLTIADVRDDGFSVSIIPHTMRATIMMLKSIGDSVNLENDIIGKYIERLMLPEAQKSPGITAELLTRAGF